jgi:hypothetical protein
MGSCEIIGSRFYIFQWAHPSTSAVHCVKNNGPLQNHRQWPLHMPMGPFGYIGSAPYKTNGPMRSHRQMILHMPMGPSQCIGGTSCKKIVGPFKIIGSKLYIFQWAHPGASAMHRVKNSGPMRNHWQKTLHMPMGPSQYIGDIPYEK